MANKNLTNEKVIKRFESQFDLVNYAIGLAKNMIYSGREGRVKTDKYSKACMILEEIIEEKDKYDDVEAGSLENNNVDVEKGS